MQPKIMPLHLELPDDQVIILNDSVERSGDRLSGKLALEDIALDPCRERPAGAVDNRACDA